MREERIELIRTTQPFIEGEKTDLRQLRITLQRIAVSRVLKQDAKLQMDYFHICSEPNRLLPG